MFTDTLIGGCVRLGYVFLHTYCCLDLIVGSEFRIATQEVSTALQLGPIGSISTVHTLQVLTGLNPGSDQSRIVRRGQQTTASQQYA
jgi:hypothetical protein